MRIRVRGPDGVAAITLDDSATIGELKRTIAEKTGVSAFDVKKGYPPHPLELDAFGDGTTLSDAGINLNGEQLIIARREPKGEVQQPVSNPGSGSNKGPAATASTSRSTPQAQNQGSTSMSAARPKIADETPEIAMPSRDSTLMLRVMPADNSCMFRAFSYLMFGPSIDSMHELRSMVASTIQSNPERYSDAILGRPRDAYCRWIQTESSWGGYVELTILAEHFGIGVASVSVEDGRVDQYNEQASRRCILVYSGIHYDAIAESPHDRLGFGRKSAPDEDIKTFDSDDDVVLATARDLCKILRDRNYHVNVSDVETGSMTCKVCGWKGSGMDEVTQHAINTGHMEMSQG